MMQGKIAVEEHFVPAGLEELITNPGWPDAALQRVLGRLRDIDGRLEQMEALGIEKAVLSLGAFGIQDVVEPARAVEQARRANDALAEIARAHPTRLAGLAALPM